MIYVAKNHVLLKPLGETQHESGIILPEDQSQKPTIGIVEQVGEGKQPFPVPMEKGDTVVFKKYMSNEQAIPQLTEKLNPIPFEDLTILIKEDKKKEGKK
jgi:co-chaperonin GroES (HSP10)